MCEENEARREEEGASLKRRTSAEEHTTKAVDIIEGQWIVMVNTPVNSPLFRSVSSGGDYSVFLPVSRMAITARSRPLPVYGVLVVHYCCVS